MQIFPRWLLLAQVLVGIEASSASGPHHVEVMPGAAMLDLNEASEKGTGKHAQHRRTVRMEEVRPEDESEKSDQSVGSSTDKVSSQEPTSFMGDLNETNPCGIANPCQPCDDDASTFCSVVAPTANSSQRTTCVKICGVAEPLQSMMGIADSSGKKCLGGYNTDNYRELYRRTCPNVSREIEIEVGSVKTKSKTTDCYFDMATVDKGTPAQGDEETSRTFRYQVEVEDKSTVKTWCQPAYAPSIDTMTCTLGYLFPPTFECLPLSCTAPDVSSITNSHPSGACEEGDSISERSWCTPRCGSGYKPAFKANSPGYSLACDSSEKKNPLALCCQNGALAPPVFECEPFIEVSSTLKSEATKMLLNVVAESVPDGVRVLSVDSGQNQTTDHIWVMDQSNTTGRYSIGTNFVGIDSVFMFEAELTEPLPATAVPLPARGRALFQTRVQGDLDLLWEDDSLSCQPKQLKCTLTLLKVQAQGTDTDDDTTMMISPPREWSPHSWEWMDKYQDTCGWNICNKLDEYATGVHNLRPIDGNLYSNYVCSGLDPAAVVVVPVILGPIFMLVYTIFSKQILLDRWKKQYAEERKSGSGQEERMHQYLTTHRQAAQAAQAAPAASEQ